MRYLIILFFILILYSCAKDKDDLTLNDLKGKWIEVVTKSDTLTFSPMDKRLTLGRGKEMRNGSLLPKFKSGLYEYKLQDESISLYWMLSSNYNFSNYSFELKDDKLYIGNFYESTSGAILTFERFE